MSLSSYAEKLVEQGIIPGLTVAVARGEQLVYHRCWGYRSLKPEKRPLHLGTIYDLASLTKPLVTALGLMMLFEKQKEPLEKPLRRYLHGFPEKIRIIDLLTHTSGLRDWYPLYLDSEQGYLDTIRKMPLAHRPRRRVHYSCLGYILLAMVVEVISGMEFTRFASERIIAPLRLSRSFLGSVSPHHRREGSVAPTERGNGYERRRSLDMHLPGAKEFPWRTQIIHGETHDGNAYYRRGCAGNAGLFSTVEDLARWTREFYPSTTSLLHPETAELFWENFTPWKGGRRTAGYKKNPFPMGSGGMGMESNAIGHNGFTGVSLWMERKSGKRYIVLTNRVHPGVDVGVDFQRVRRRIHRMMCRYPDGGVVG